jgi:hypothetical protein
MAGAINLSRSRRRTRPYDVNGDNLDQLLDQVNTKFEAIDAAAAETDLIARTADQRALNALRRGNHSGTQRAETIEDFSDAVLARILTVLLEGPNITLTPDLVAGTLTIEAAGGTGSETFETVSQNLRAEGATLTYSGGDLVQIDYADGIVKTFTYGVDGLLTITLSGATPGGIDLVKTLSYTAGELTGIAYS